MAEAKMFWERPRAHRRFEVLRRGFALVCAALLGGAASATELDYSGEVYRYRANRDDVYKEYRYHLEDASWGFDLGAFPSRFSSAKETYHVAVPVTLKSGSVKAENVAVSLEGVVHPGELSSAKVYDDRAFMKMVCPADTSRWEDWDDRWGYEDDSEHREWPKDVWPGKAPVSGRYWVLTQLNGAIGNWSGQTHLKIEVRDDVNGSFDSVVVPLGRQEMVDLPGDSFFGGSSMTVKPLPKYWWVKFHEAYGSGDGWFWLDYEDHLHDELELPIDVREAGVLRVVYSQYHEPLEAQGRNIVSSRDTESDWGIRCLEVEVSAATTLTVRNDEGEAEIREISFWPSGSRCVRVAADDEYVELCDHDKSYLRGYVLGSGVYKSGETATLTAVAGNTSVFVRWESDEIDLDPAAATNAHLSFTVPDSVCAAADARAEVRIRAVWRDRLPGEGGPAPSYGPFAPGAQVSIDLPGLVGYTAKGLPAGLRFDSKAGRITGAATKAGATATVTFTKRGAETYVTQIVVDSFPRLTVEVNDAAGGKVTGAGAYAVGKKITLKATPAKGYVFAGWYADVPEVDDECGEVHGEPLAGDVDWRTPSFPYVTGTEDATVYACFVPADMDDGITVFCCMADEIPWDGWQELDFSYVLRDSSLSLPTAKVSGLPAGLKYDAKAMKISGRPAKPGVYACTLTLSNAAVRNVVETFTITVPNLESDRIRGLDPDPGAYAFVAGVALDASALAPRADDGYALKVSGLPAGLRYDAKTGRVAGVPTKPGTYTVTVTGTKRGAPAETATVTLTVEAMPEAVAGGLTGFVADGGGAMAGSFAFAATAAGRLTAKVATARGAASFSAPSWTRVEEDCCRPDGRTFVAEMADAKTGCALTLAVDEDGTPDAERCAYAGADGVYAVDAVRNVFSRRWHFAAYGYGDADGEWRLEAVATAAEADVTVTLKDGTATVSGRLGAVKVGGTTAVRVEADGRLRVRLPAFAAERGRTRLVDFDLYERGGEATLR